MDREGKGQGARQAQWRDWIQSHGAQLLLFARQRTRTYEDAEDLVQVAILRSWRSNPECLCPEMGLVIRAICWGAIDQGRRETRRQGRETEYQRVVEVNMGSFFEADFESQERAHMVQEALQDLDSDQRDVILLKVWGEMTAVEIAEALDLSANTVASRYRYGLRTLKKRLGAVLL